jgi:hypothetical protein
MLKAAGRSPAGLPKATAPPSMRRDDASRRLAPRRSFETHFKKTVESPAGLARLRKSARAAAITITITIEECT